MLLCCVKNRSQSEEPGVVLTLEDANEIITFAVGINTKLTYLQIVIYISVFSFKLLFCLEGKRE